MITLKLTNKQLEILHRVHLDRVILEKGPYYDLLREHCYDFADFFFKKSASGAKTRKIKFTSLQARAFMILWIGERLPAELAVPVLDMIRDLDKAHKNSMIINAYENRKAILERFAKS